MYGKPFWKRSVEISAQSNLKFLLHDFWWTICNYPLRAYSYKLVKDYQYLCCLRKKCPHSVVYFCERGVRYGTSEKQHFWWWYFRNFILIWLEVAERLALPTSDHGVAGSNPAGGEILPEPKRRFIAQSLSCSPFHRLEITEILLKGRKTLTHPSS